MKQPSNKELYFIRTEFDLVSFRPIWALKNISVTHNHKNGSYQNSDVALKVDGYKELIKLSSKAEVATTFSKIKVFDARLREAISLQQFDYLDQESSFLVLSPAISSKHINVGCGTHLRRGTTHLHEAGTPIL